ncbi:hypothetical protein SELMODRAFT_403082 [Selaginella moellendorffii]|uniref:Mitochondrial import receptor subunit TOM40-1 n=1 Tax=Selaginella moellendorffii TaxID=88036 RepID=D8QNZ8_SELML|nr:mitochondrial import receptor subunit TOM40-1 [Selaginella moellendorffii]XP_002983251.1 mitochondrial import receptor subunit TOM40-1 [Selaginella moellendorffii]EFJ15593.1 hypothetical protein SELMODRAFT_180110 [Selaginella moellendorffii]EFJ38844.1 hypothetical protein SELMODRAFT_403082 [Selaginella moellendorffii]|eukprot:XP_002961305.1 mitochondrial import receptor subunit TOM40-1 [Selaginella moellendorffii]
MGSNLSHAAAPPPPPVATPDKISPQPPAAPPAKEDEKPDAKVDYFNLPCPVKYEEIQREVSMALKPDLFEGLRFDFNRPLNEVFSLSHSVLMGSIEVPQQSPQIVKVPSAHYEFGANFLSPRLFLVGRVLTDGRLNARVKADFTENFSMRLNAQLTNEPHFSQGMFQFDYKGKDYQTQFQFGNRAFYGANYIQSITPSLALGGEVFWVGHQRKSGLGLAARYSNDKVIATGQVATTGMVSLTYVQRVSQKVNLATDFLYNALTKEAITSIGYDYILRQSRVRGRLDTNGCVAAFLEERLNVGVTFLLSAEIDHWKKDYKFGFGLTVGE